MTVELLREAAALMRERADVEPLWPKTSIDRRGTCDGCAESKRLVASYDGPDSEPWLCAECEAAMDHGASMTGPVALALVDWLEVAARRIEWHEQNGGVPYVDDTYALAVASDYLRTAETHVSERGSRE